MMNRQQRQNLKEQLGVKYYPENPSLVNEIVASIIQQVRRNNNNRHIHYIYHDQKCIIVSRVLGEESIHAEKYAILNITEEEVHEVEYRGADHD